MASFFRLPPRLPPPLSWFYEAWMEFSKVLGRVMSAIILTILWLVGFGAYGIVIKVVRLFAGEQARDSYWLEVKKHPEDSLKHQF